eukprot:COSAG01_NODE_76339_length_186_cov_531.379310_1_plen_45_part_10
MCGGLAPGRRPGGGASLTGACGEQGPTHKLVLTAKNNYATLLSSK